MVLADINYAEEVIDKSYLSDCLKIFIVDKYDNLYKEGRDLAQQMYNKVWNTSNLIDANDYAVVIYCGNMIVGNVNIELGREGNLLKSEVFFEKQHWKNYLSASRTDLIEISGLCINDEIPNKLSRPVMMLLILGLQSLHNSLGIRYMTTVQHKYLIRILKKSLNLPFFRNEVLNVPLGSIPDDNYWKQDKMPSLYYVDGHSNEAIKACNSMFCYLNFLGFKISFESKINKSEISYSEFWNFFKGSNLFAA